MNQLTLFGEPADTHTAKNRVNRGGIPVPGAGLIKYSEDGRGHALICGHSAGIHKPMILAVEGNKQEL